MRQSTRRAGRGRFSRLSQSGLFRTVAVVVAAVVLGLLAVLGTHWFALTYAGWLQAHALWLASIVEDKIGSLIVDAVTAATASAGTVYVLTVSVLIRETKDQIRLSIRQGFLGDMDIPNLAQAVANHMTRLHARAGAGPGGQARAIGDRLRGARGPEMRAGKVRTSGLGHDCGTTVYVHGFP